MSKVYYTYILILIIFNGLIWITPVLARANNPATPGLYSSFSNICHQLTARSVCLYDSNIGDCTPQNGLFSSDKTTFVFNEQGIGFKFPVDVRDMAIYLSMLLAGFLLPFISNVKSYKVPNVLFLVLASAPVAIDGFTQLFGWRESTNGIRIITGVILGAAIPFVLIPTVNFFVKKFRRGKQTDFNLNT